MDETKVGLSAEREAEIRKSVAVYDQLRRFDEPTMEVRALLAEIDRLRAEQPATQAAVPTIDELSRKLSGPWTSCEARASWVLSLIREHAHAAPVQAGEESPLHANWVKREHHESLHNLYVTERRAKDDADHQIAQLRDDVRRREGELERAMEMHSACIAERDNLRDVVDAPAQAFQVTREEAEAIAKKCGWQNPSPSAAKCYIDEILAKRSPEPAQAVADSYVQSREYYEEACAHYSATVAQLEAANKRCKELRSIGDLAMARESETLDRAERAEARLASLRDVCALTKSELFDVEYLREQGKMLVQVFDRIQAALNAPPQQPTEVTADPEAPLDVAALPDFWDGRRPRQGKTDKSRCAAELRRALGQSGEAAKPEAPASQRELRVRKADGTPWVDPGTGIAPPPAPASHAELAARVDRHDRTIRQFMHDVRTDETLSESTKLSARFALAMLDGKETP